MINIKEKLTGKPNVKINERVRDLFTAKAELSALTSKIRKLEAEVKKAVKESPNGEIKTYSVVKGSRVNIRAGFDEQASNRVDKTKLMAEIGLEDYAKTATVTQAAVTKSFGSNVLDKCLITGVTKRFSVKQVSD